VVEQTVNISERASRVRVKTIWRRSEAGEQGAADV